jgi:peptidyl-prolyl cis-trans isomerase B (cyclophilin B)
LKKYIVVFIISFLSLQFTVSAQEKVRIITTQGEMVVYLYPETELHKANFLRLVENNFYDSILFHRVIKDFMIQAGDPYTRPKNMKIADISLKKVPAEINPKYIHKKGALAAARQGDDVNPEKKSSSSQFYIVQGRRYPRKYLPAFEEKNGVIYTETQKDLYEDIGGTPHLDGEYTVFGEVIQGLGVIDKIAQGPTTVSDKPNSAVYILKMEVIN